MAIAEMAQVFLAPGGVTNYLKTSTLGLALAEQER
jgi:hypothetical protein